MKPENILIDTKGDLFLCDFGNSLNIKTKQKWGKINFSPTDKYSCPEKKHLESW